MITFVCWLWGDRYTAEHVNMLGRMLRRNCYATYRLVCVTNNGAGINPSIDLVTDRADHADATSPHGASAPSCYRRLRLFERDAGLTFGDRIVNLDLDCVITDDLSPLFEFRTEAFVGWQDPFYPQQICGSMFMLTAGAHPEVWERFDAATSPKASLAAGYRGSDQGWISYCLPGAAKWTRAEGVYSFRVDRCADRLPPDSRIVFFHGRTKPWDAEAQRVPWVRYNYQ